MRDPHMKYLSIAMMVVMTASCTTIQTVPEYWKLPMPEQGDRCPDISGRYVNSGEKIDSKSRVDMQWQWFFGSDVEKYAVPPGKWLEISQILIRQENANQLEIVGLSASGALQARRIFKKEHGDYSCQDGWLKVTGSNYSGSSGSVGVYNFIRSFKKADGYLIQREEYDAFGLILILPIKRDGTLWYRYSQVAGGDDRAPAQ